MDVVTPEQVCQQLVHLDTIELDFIRLALPKKLEPAQ